MRTIYQNYTLLTSETPTFFAGANTGSGFVGEYSRIASEDENARVWIIKGGSGTGKSTLMRKIETAAEEAGHRCVRYLCSSDPTSLDAVSIDGQYVILDGTAPHVWEMEYPGAASEIVYVGKYWKREKLEGAREEIIRLTKAKKAAFQSGYTVLSALSRLEKEAYRSSMGLLDREKLVRFLQRTLKSVPKADRCGGVTICRTWAITVNGPARTDGLAHMADVHWRIEDTLQTAPCFFEVLAEVCRELNIPVRLSLHPVNDRILEAYIPPLSLHLSVEAEAPDRNICMSRFLGKELSGEKKGMIRLSARCMMALLEQACGRFREAGEIHGEIEKIYVDAMDFTQLNRESAGIRKQILKTIGGE